MIFSYIRKQNNILKMIRNFSQVMVKEDNNVKTVILSNTKTRNALSLSMLKELKEAILFPDPELRCIILKGEGKVFSSGHNLKELLGDLGRQHHTDIFQSCSELMMGMTRVPVPIIAQVNGLAAAAGCQLVASCDIVVASNNASFMTPGANFGLFCSTPGIALVRSVSRKVSADMLLSGLPLSARDAFNAGLVSVLVAEEEELESETQRRVDAICSKSRSVIALGKKFLYEQVEMSLEDAYRFGSEVMVSNVNLVDGQEGIRSFVEKRKPVWTHRHE